jgi:hypothetical protein
MGFDDEDLYFTPHVRRLAGRDLANYLLRYELASAGKEGRTTMLPQLVSLADAQRMPLIELRRISGFARDTLYKARSADLLDALSGDQRDAAQRLLLLALQIAGGPLSLGELADLLKINVAQLELLAQELNHEGLVAIQGAPELSELALRPTERTVNELRRRATDLELGLLNDTFMVWFAIEDPDKVAEVAKIARDLSEGLPELRDVAVIPASIAPSSMAHSELGLSIRATHQRAATAIANEYWSQIENSTRLPARMTAISAPPTLPSANSDVLDAYLAGMGSVLDEESHNRAEQIRAAYFGGETERALTKACLTEAARAFRRLKGEGRPDVVVGDGERAFRELELLGPGDEGLDHVREPLQKALRTAADRLGPYRGGELGSFKAPGSAPRVPREVSPSAEELCQMARLAGEAAAAAAASPEDAAGSVRAVASS